jgi:hypothetical protein
VQVVRVADDQSWVELMMPGPLGSFYEGTTLPSVVYVRFASDGGVGDDETC